MQGACLRFSVLPKDTPACRKARDQITNLAISRQPALELPNNLSVNIFDFMTSFAP